MALDARRGPGDGDGGIKRVAEQLGIHPEALRTWVRQAEIDGGLRPGTTTDDTSRISELERDIRELRQADEILHTAAAFSPQRSRLRASTYRAGVLFVLPGMLALLGLSAVYVAYDDTRCRPKVVSNSAQAAPRETTKMRILASEDGVNGTPSVRSRDHSRGSIGDFLRRYTVQVSNDGRTWTDIAMGPGRPSLTGEMVIALPSTTARYLRLVSGATAGSWWSIHELNLRTVAGSADPGPPGDGLVRATGRLPGGTWVGGYYNSGSTAAEVPWPINGFGYTYRLPPTAAVTFALPGRSPATQRAHPASPLGRPGHGITHR